MVNFVIFYLQSSQYISTWQNGSPLVFQQYKHYYYGRALVRYFCLVNLFKLKSTDIWFSGAMSLYNMVNQYVFDFESGICLNIHNHKKTLQNAIQGSVTSNRACTIMILSNLAEPDWLSIPCEEKTLYYTVCVEKNSEILSENERMNSKSLYRKQCGLLHVTALGVCYAFMWQETFPIQNNFCETLRGKSTNLDELGQLKHLFKTLPAGVKTPNIFVKYKQSTILATRFVVETFNIFTQIQTNISRTKREGYFLCKFNTFETMVHSVTYQCAKGGYISLNDVCDQTIDCPNDNSDEQDCKYSIFLETDNKNHHTQLVQKCEPLYFTNMHGSCKQHSSKFIYKKKRLVLSSEVITTDLSYNIHNNYFPCRTGEMIHLLLVNDLIPDCKTEDEDEHLLKTILTNHITKNLCKSNEIPCIDGHSKCFSFTDICIYRVNSFGHLQPCRNGAHLQNCKLVECSLKFKCKSAYCIPWSNVCNGKWDCPEGDDEIFTGICGKINICIQMYKCKGTKHVCIHSGNICDTNQDCPYGDDEMYCELKNRICPDNCNCLYFAVVCKNLKMVKYTFYNSDYVMVDISSSEKIVITTFLKVLHNVQVLRLQENSMQDVCKLFFPDYLRMLDVSINLLVRINSFCFSMLLYLRILILHHNNILYLFSNSFFYMTSLELLDISNNPLTYIPRHSFTLLPAIRLINFSHIKYNYIDKDIFIKMLPKLIITSHYGILCFIPDGTKYIFTSPFQSIKPCTGIVPNRFFNFLIGFISIMIITFNFLSSIFHFFNNRLGKAFKVTIITMDFHYHLCGIYLFIIWTYDTIFSDTFINDQIWRSHFLCFLASGVILSFEISSQFLLLFLSISRLMVVTFPFKSKFKDVRFTTTCLSVLCGLSFFISCILILFYKIQYSISQTTFCLPFSNPLNPLIYWMTWFIIILKFVVSFAIFLMGFCLLRTFKGSNQLQSVKISEKSNYMFYQSNFQIILNVLCWYPMNIIYIVLLFSSSYHPILLQWATVTILPINCLFSPIVFISSLLMSKVNKLM